MHLEVETYGRRPDRQELGDGGGSTRCIERELQAKVAKLGDDVAVKIDVLVADSTRIRPTTSS
jgi:hypothetical protein